jgi:hypothetical protein
VSSGAADESGGLGDNTERGSQGKADATGSCASSSCSGKASAGSCYCDAACEAYGDCCSDYREACTAGALDPNEQLPMAFVSPVSADAFLAVLGDQVEAADAALSTQQASALVASTSAALLDQGKALMVSGFASSPTQATCPSLPCRSSGFALAAYDPGVGAEAFGWLTVTDYSDPTGADVAQLLGPDNIDPQSLIIAFSDGESISIEVLVESMRDQLDCAARAFAEEQFSAAVEKLATALVSENASLMVQSFVSPTAGSYCRANACRETSVIFHRYSLGSDSVPYAKLQFRNFADPDRPDELETFLAK